MGSSESAVTVPEPLSFNKMIEQTDAAASSGASSTGFEVLSRTCGIPDRLFLPKGKEEGLEMVLMSFVSDGATDHTDTFEVGGHYGGTMPTVVSMDRSTPTSVPWASLLIVIFLISV